MDPIMMSISIILSSSFISAQNSLRNSWWQESWDSLQHLTFHLRSLSFSGQTLGISISNRLSSSDIDPSSEQSSLCSISEEWSSLEVLENWSMLSLSEYKSCTSRSSPFLVSVPVSAEETAATESRYETCACSVGWYFSFPACFSRESVGNAVFLFGESKEENSWEEDERDGNQESSMARW